MITFYSERIRKSTFGVSDTGAHLFLHPPVRAIERVCVEGGVRPDIRTARDVSYV
jgi:hypothetical protein